MYNDGFIKQIRPPSTQYQIAQEELLDHWFAG